MNHRAKVTLLLAAFALCACVEVDTRITLSPDGPGTVETTVVLDPILALMMQVGALAGPDQAPPEQRALCAQLPRPPNPQGLAIADRVPAGHLAESACRRTIRTPDWRRDLERLLGRGLVEVREHDGRIRIAFDASSALEAVASDPDMLCSGAADAAKCRTATAELDRSFADLADVSTQLDEVLGGGLPAPSYRVRIEGAVHPILGFTLREGPTGARQAVFHSRCDPGADPGCGRWLRSLRWAFDAAPVE